MTNNKFKYLGKRRRLVEGMEKVIGYAQYTADLKLPGMLHARPVLSPYAHARILSIDKSEAEAVSGVVAVLTAYDLPTRDKVIASRNSAVLAKEKVLFRGQPVAVVVAETEMAAQDAADLLFIDYEPLPAVVDVLDAIKPDAPIVWPDGLPQAGTDLSSAHASVDKEGEASDEPTLRNASAENHYHRGDVVTGLAAADVIVERTYRTQMVHQAYMEPHACVAEPHPLGQGLTLYTSTQGSFLVRDEVAELLSLSPTQVRVVPMTLGGGFGAKYGIIEPLTGAIALTLKRPIRLVLTRSEDFLTTTPAHAVVIELKSGATRDGVLTALQARIFMDNGIFNFPMAGLVATLLGGYYKCANVQIDAYEVNTNKPQAGAYRAPGSPQATFAIESNVDEMARELGIDPLAFRLKNAAETGDPMGNGAPWPEMGLKKCLQALEAHPAWQNRVKGPHEGYGVAIGGWPAFMTPSSAVCHVDTDGTVSIQVGTVDISGVNSSFVLVAAELLGISPDQVRIVAGDTQNSPFGAHSGGSQVTYSVAGAVAGAAEAARCKLLQIAADEFEACVEDVELVDGEARVKGVPDRTLSIGRLAKIARSRQGGLGPVVGEGSTAVPENAPGFVAHLVKVRIDPETGRVQPIQYVAVQDVGFALNPLMVEGQMQGGAAQGIGLALHEAMVYDADGQLISGTFMDYDLPRFDSIPEIETIMLHNPSPHGPFGARGIGEPPITAGAAAIANAIRDAVGVRVSELPIRAETVWELCQKSDD